MTHTFFNDINGNATKPVFTLSRTMASGKPAVELTVQSPSQEMVSLLTDLGFTTVVGILNRYHKICTNPAEVDAARNPLATMFDTTGKFLG